MAQPECFIVLTRILRNPCTAIVVVFLDEEGLLGRNGLPFVLLYMLSAQKVFFIVHMHVSFKCYQYTLDVRATPFWVLNGCARTKQPIGYQM